MRSLGKALELLELLNRSRVPMTLQALSQASGYPKSTIHSLLATLRSYGCIRQESRAVYWVCWASRSKWGRAQRVISHAADTPQPHSNSFVPR